MITYRPGDDVGLLQSWPFDSPASDYRITRGNPAASGRIDDGGPGQTTRFGIWACTAGAFSCIEQGDEMMTILSGHGTLIDMETGRATPFQAGDTLFSHDGKRVSWDIAEDVVKVFYGYKADGFA